MATFGREKRERENKDGISSSSDELDLPQRDDLLLGVCVPEFRESAAGLRLGPKKECSRSMIEFSHARASAHQTPSTARVLSSNFDCPLLLNRCLFRELSRCATLA